MAKKTHRSVRSKPARKSPLRSFKAELASRLQEVAGNQTYKEIGQATSTHPENARRYMQMGTASVYFLAKFAKAYKVSPGWLLDGSGQRSRR